MTDAIESLRIHAEIEANSTRLSLRDSEPQDRAARIFCARRVLMFLEQNVLPVTAHLGTELSRQLVELRAEIARQPDLPTRCCNCKAAQAVETLAAAIAAQLRANGGHL